MKDALTASTWRRTPLREMALNSVGPPSRSIHSGTMGWIQFFGEEAEENSAPLSMCPHGRQHLDSRTATRKCQDPSGWETKRVCEERISLKCRSAKMQAWGGRAKKKREQEDQGKKKKKTCMTRRIFFSSLCCPCVARIHRDGE